MNAPAAPPAPPTLECTQSARAASSPWLRRGLIALAVVLSGLITFSIVGRAGSSPATDSLAGIFSPAVAKADLVNQLGDFQMLAVDGGSEDVVLVIDQRSEAILIYNAQQNGLKFLGKRDIRDIFLQARTAAGK